MERRRITEPSHKSGSPKSRCHLLARREKIPATGSNMADDDPYRELGRRLLAAVMSYRLGLKSVDYTLKNYIAAEEIDPSWSKLGEELDRTVAESSGHAVVPFKALTDKIQ
jgi:hypothetical protein